MATPQPATTTSAACIMHYITILVIIRRNFFAWTHTFPITLTLLHLTDIEKKTINARKPVRIIRGRHV